jgi:hypothetical protein
MLTIIAQIVSLSTLKFRVDHDVNVMIGGRG